MVASNTAVRRDALAHTMFQFVTQFCLTQPRVRRRNGNLKEPEFLTLALLHQRETMIVGDIQRMLGVLPAQMSRIIRSLEDRECPLIACRINPEDKRKIDVRLTPAGAQALLDYQADQMRNLSAILSRLSDEDQEDLARLLAKMQGILNHRPEPRYSTTEATLA